MRSNQNPDGKHLHKLHREGCSQWNEELKHHKRLDQENCYQTQNKGAARRVSVINGRKATSSNRFRDQLIPKHLLPPDATALALAMAEDTYMAACHL